jgi:hypothetical protein
MESGNKQKILEMIKAIEEKNSEIEDFISNLSMLTRNDMLIEITRDIISNNALLQELLGTEEKIAISEDKDRKSFGHIIDGYITRIQKEPYKKIIFLREFLDLFEDRVSETDKDVILKSLKDEKNYEKLREEMLSLANIFKPKKL